MSAAKPAPPREPDVSFIMPCYNEQDVIPYTVPQLLVAFERAGHVLELIVCDNGSTDRTGAVIQELRSSGLPIVSHRVEVNEGYGKGVLESIPLCRAPWIGIIPADGQVDAEDVVRLFEVVKHQGPRTMAKVRRRFRLDGLRRKVISVAYNLFVFVLWPGLGSIDVNGSPKIVHRDALARMNLHSKDWFLDPELMVKANYLGVRVLEMNVFARMRGSGLSHVRVSTCWGFFWNLLGFRFGRELTDWRREVREASPLSATASRMN
jgi:glycosyltransferase involved in cell wall biosynthesis